MSGKTAARIVIAALGGIALGGLATLAIRSYSESRPLPPLPPAPTISVPRGDPPEGIVAFEERVNGHLNGSGFLLQLPDGDAIGVTTAHSLGEGNFWPLEFRIAGTPRVAAAFDTLYVPLGRPRTDADMTVDYVLMRAASPPDPAFVLTPDPRGEPQPGERVLLHSGLGDGRGGPRVLPGTVESVDANGGWIRMDEVFEPGLMSGSPIVSAHTGRVVGMTIAATRAGGALLIGINPIGAIVAAALSK